MRIIVAVVIVIALCVGFWLYSSDRAMQREQQRTQMLARNCERGGTEVDFDKAIGSREYRNPDYSRLTARYSELRDGMDMNAVGQLLGKPTYAQALVDKDGVGFTGCDWIYMLERNADDSDKDLISVLIDANGKVSGHFWKKHPGE